MPQRLLIYYLHRHDGINGAITHTIDTAIALQQRGMGVWVETASKTLFDSARHNKISVSRIGLGSHPERPFRLFLFLLYACYGLPRIALNLLYYRLIHRVSVLYIISKTDKFLITPCARALGMRVLWVEHELFAEHASSAYRAWYSLLSPSVQIVTDSQAVKYQLIEKWGIPNNRVKTIYPGIAGSDYHGAPTAALAHMKEKTEGKFIIGIVCRLTKEKGVEFLINALDLLRASLPEAILVIVGDGPEKEHLQWLVKMKNLDNRVTFTGFQKNLTLWYPLFDLFVLPSIKKESFGTVLLEAMHFSIPVIATTVGGLPEIITDGDTGTLVPPADATAIAKAIVKIHNEPAMAHEMVERAFDMIEQKFTKEHMLQAFYELITKEESR